MAPRSLRKFTLPVFPLVSKGENSNKSSRSLVPGTLRNREDDGNGNVEKTIGLMITTLHVHHAFLYIYLPSLHNYDVK